MTGDSMFVYGNGERMRKGGGEDSSRKEQFLSAAGGEKREAEGVEIGGRHEEVRGRRR